MADGQARTAAIDYREPVIMADSSDDPCGRINLNAPSSRPEKKSIAPVLNSYIGIEPSSRQPIHEYSKLHSILSRSPVAIAARRSFSRDII